jgi:hypothetical protein
MFCKKENENMIMKNRMKNRNSRFTWRVTVAAHLLFVLEGISNRAQRYRAVGVRPQRVVNRRRLLVLGHHKRERFAPGVAQVDLDQVVRTVDSDSVNVRRRVVWSRSKKKNRWATDMNENHQQTDAKKIGKFVLPSFHSLWVKQD